MTSTPASTYNVDSAIDGPRGTKRKNLDDLQGIQSSERPQKRKYFTRSTRKRLQKETITPTQHAIPERVQAVPQQTAYVPDHQFYFKDGDLFVTIPGNKTLFLVHRKNLVGLGGYFEDTLAGDLVHLDFRLYSLPHYPLPEFVAFRDFRFLLAYLYGTITISKELPDGSGYVYFEATLSLIRINEQLGLSKPREIAVAALKYLFPTTFRPNFKQVTIAGLKLHEEEMFFRTFPIRAVNVITQYGLDALRPMAFYHASQLSMDDLFNGVRSGDDENGALDRITDWQVFRKIVEGRERIQSSRRKVLFEWLEVPVTANVRLSEECEQRRMKSRETCLGFLAEVCGEFRKTNFLDGRCDALLGLNPRGHELFEEHLCENCWPVAEGHIYEAARKNWEQLPEYFGLEPWETPEGQEEAA
ncbi:hypothetical protein NLJ89_g371 [Agrocybe chaxingu]|uniref:BTB domain-containing protein n=1 Tax=Agrocybe chaxingu TaxID=84603 RepID=A0A9W8TF68_9AGAR|nr:hypothetical protein NLJ89_g371 [Agrocybe chaxingu]